MSEKVMICFDQKMKQYDLGVNHPFRGDRFANAMEFFEAQGLFNLPNIIRVTPQPASKEDLLRVHDERYVDLIFHLADEGRAYDFETPVSLSILEAAMLIVGSAIKCGESVLEGKAKRGVAVGGGYHHAGRNYGGGFCLFNDVAVLVESLRTRFGLERVLILDYDVHFGNGTSDIYYRDPSILYISLHQDPSTIYPGTGFVHQIGEGKGEGFNVNVPLPPGTGDATYLYALNEVFVPLAEEFKPEIILANGGSDSHFADMLGNLGLTVNGFFGLSNVIRETSDHACGGKLVLMPGSGYNPKVLPLCWYALVAGVVGVKELNVKDPYPPPAEPLHCRKAVEKTVDELKRLLRSHWSCFEVSR